MKTEKEGKEGKGSRWPLLSAAVLLVTILVTAAVLFFEPASWQKIIADPHSNRLLFVLVMAVLPIFGVSIIIFLVVIGIKFGTLGGILISGVLMLFHMLVTFLISHSFFRPQLNRFLGEHHWAPPALPAGKKELYAFLFMIIPGLPYPVKNYLLALTGLPFLHYLIICWSAQMALGIPFIVLGEAVKSKHVGALFIVVVMLVSGFLMVRWLRREFNSSSPQDR
jgi:uncharacterized membrane protein YdjX (TVP38/TMEM64 family)